MSNIKIYFNNYKRNALLLNIALVLVVVCQYYAPYFRLSVKWQFLYSFIKELGLFFHSIALMGAISNSWYIYKLEEINDKLFWIFCSLLPIIATLIYILHLFQIIHII